MIDQAKEDFAIDMSRSFVVGDYITDIGLAHAAGIPGILVRTGYGEASSRQFVENDKPDYIADDLLAAVTWRGRVLGLLDGSGT